MTQKLLAAGSAALIGLGIFNAIKWGGIAAYMAGKWIGSH